jgi:hypothetical protein
MQSSAPIPRGRHGSEVAEEKREAYRTALREPGAEFREKVILRTMTPRVPLDRGPDAAGPSPDAGTQLSLGTDQAVPGAESTLAARRSLPASCYRVAVVDVQKLVVIDRASSPSTCPANTPQREATPAPGRRSANLLYPPLPYPPHGTPLSEKNASGSWLGGSAPPFLIVHG